VIALEQRKLTKYRHFHSNSSVFKLFDLLLNGFLMPDKNEKAHRKSTQRAAREDAKQKVRDTLPVPAPVLKALFDYVDRRLKSTECDHTLRHALDFIRNNALPEQAVICWLRGNHGYCDCETLWNSEEVLEEAVPGYGEMEPSTKLP
jgi:hypothetical protein